MVDLTALKKEYFSARKEQDNIRTKYQQQNQLVEALKNLILAKGGDLEPVQPESQQELNVVESSPPTSKRELIREAIPEKGVKFTINDLLNSPSLKEAEVDRASVSFVLWLMAKKGALKNTSKGKRGSEGIYERV
jgi:hypothetical protein